MDHVSVLKQKVGELRAEIAQIHMLNQQFRRETNHDAASEMADMRRQSRLQEIQRELARFSEFGKPGTSSGKARDHEPSGGPFLVKKAS
jgi:hypothetical protein